MDGFDRSIAIAAQAFTALFPLLIIGAVILEGGHGASVGDEVIERFGLTGDAASAVRGPCAVRYCVGQMAHRSSTFTLAIAALICGALTAPALTASAGAAERGAETFEGVCEMSGTIRHEPPLTMEPAPTEVHGRFRGTCSGTFTDRDGRTHQLDGAPAKYEVRDAGGDLSCLGGTATGTGRLLFAGLGEIEFRLTERRPAPGLAVVTLEGAAGGSATVFGTLSPSEDLRELNERCNGSGLRLVRGDARIVSLGLSG
jgi:hypothetical protein